ncbi:MAG: stage II sporulation protein M [archaeon]|jgi:stage II sporulation protein M|nr:stage II sporulation protein M [archaeon]
MRAKIKNKKEKKKSFRNFFSEAVGYLGESRNYIYAVMLIFAASILLGAAYYEELGFIEDLLKEILGKIEGLSTFKLILFIFGNNLQSALYGLIFGMFFGIFPVLNALSNGVVLGYVFRKIFAESGVGEFWRILPHGIFELPAIFLSLGLGLKLGMFLFSKNKIEELRKRLLYSLILFFCIIVPLLVVAAIIEGVLIFLYK